MAALQVTLCVLVCILISAVIDQFVPKISSPLIQIGLGLVLSLVLHISINPIENNTLFMVLFIAPLLYNEAQNADKAMLAKNKGAILSLAIGLVLISTFFVGFTLSSIVTTIPLAAAMALGAALGPTDAVAVTSLPDDVKIGERVEGILKGECLLNDATGIVCFQFAIIAANTGSFSPTDAGITFLRLFIGGALVGLVLGLICVFIVNKIKDFGLDNITFHVLFDLFMPFLIYFVAETFHFSGIIAVVAAGLVKSFKGKKIDPVMSKTTIVSSSVWGVFVYAVNGAVFVMLGLMIPDVMINLWESPSISNSHLIVFVLSIAVVLCLCRFLWILAMEHKNDKSTKWNSSLKLKNTLLMTFGGPKGAVSMAIALSIPATLPSGEAFPGRAIMLFIAGGVIIITLILSNFLMPVLMPKSLKRQAESQQAFEDNMNAILINVLREVIEQLTQRQNKYTKHATANVIKQYSKRIEDLKNNLNFDDELNIQLRLQGLQWERDFVNQQLKKGNVNTHTAFKYLKKVSARQDILMRKKSIIWKLKNTMMRIGAFVKNLPKRTKNLASNNSIQPGETAKFNTNLILEKKEKVTDIHQLQELCMHHVIELLNSELACGNTYPAEDVTNLITGYRNHLISLQQKAPSITAINDLKEKEDEVISLGLYLETEIIQQMYRDKEISFEQMRYLTDNVRLMQVAQEDF